MHYMSLIASSVYIVANQVELTLVLGYHISLKLLSTKLKESGTVWVENFSNTGSNTETKKVDKLDCGDLVIDKMVLNGISFLCVLGSPYSLGRCEPIGLVDSYTSFDIRPFENQLLSFLWILFSILLVWSNLSICPSFKNL